MVCGRRSLQDFLCYFLKTTLKAIPKKLMSLFNSIKKIFNRAKDAKADKRISAASEQASQEARQDMYIATIEAERAHKNAEFRNSPYSPLDAETRQNFTGLNYYPPDPAMQMTLPLQRVEPEPIIAIPQKSPGISARW